MAIFELVKARPPYEKESGQPSSSNSSCSIYAVKARGSPGIENVCIVFVGTTEMRHQSKERVVPPKLTITVGGIGTHARP
jgi:hypothetical protein